MICDHCHRECAVRMALKTEAGEFAICVRCWVGEIGMVRG